MKKMIAAGFAAALAAAVLIPGAAQATDDTGLNSDCANLADWKVNGDENGSDPKQGDRRPKVTDAGLEFSGNQLIHHPASLKVADLKPGDYTADPAPSLSSFFSVEVRNDDGTGYATLRWDTDLNKWTMVTGGQQYADADPAKLVLNNNRSTNVISFGVGYVNSPGDGTTTVVSEVEFAGKTYDLTCKPDPEPTVTTSGSASPSASVSSSASATPGASSSPAGGVAGGNDTGGGSLPITGPGGVVLIASSALALLIAGGGLFVLARRRKMRFTA